MIAGASHLDVAPAGFLHNIDQFILQFLRRFLCPLGRVVDAFQVERRPRQAKIQPALLLVNTDAAGSKGDELRMIQQDFGAQPQVE